MKFKSRVDWWFHGIAAMMIILMVWLCIHGVLERDLITGIVGIVILVSNALLVVPLWINTYYTLEESALCITCGLGKPLQIPYTRIRGVKETRNPLASSALSLDRLEIEFTNGGRTEFTYISPKDKKEFIHQLNRKRYRTPE